VASFYARSALGASALAVGGLTSAFYLLRAGASVASGFASATASRASRLAAAAFAGHVAVVAYLASGPGYLGLLAVRGLQGFMNGLAWTAAQVMLASSVPPGYRGRAFAVYGIAGSLGALAGDLLYASLGTRCLAVSAAAFASASAISLALPRLAPRGPGAGGAPVAGGAGARAVRGGRCVLAALLLAVSSVAYASVMGVGDIAYVYYREILGITRAETATLRGAAGFAGTLAGYLLGWLADRGAPAAALGLAYLAAYAGILSASVRSRALAALGIALITAAGRAALPTARKLASEQPRGHVYLGLLGAATNLASAAGGVAYGLSYTALDARQARLGPLSLALAPLAASLWALLLVPPALAVCLRGRAARVARKNPRPGG